jgi:hypothetical protein
MRFSKSETAIVVQPALGRDTPAPPAAASAPVERAQVDAIEDVDEDILSEDEGSQAAAPPAG